MKCIRVYQPIKWKYVLDHYKNLNSNIIQIHSSELIIIHIIYIMCFKCIYIFISAVYFVLRHFLNVHIPYLFKSISRYNNYSQLFFGNLTWARTFWRMNYFRYDTSSWFGFIAIIGSPSRVWRQNAFRMASLYKQLLILIDILTGGWSTARTQSVNY